MQWTELTRKVKPFPIILIDAAAHGTRDYYMEFHEGKLKLTDYRQAFGGRGYPTKQWLKIVELYKENEDRLVLWMKLWLNKFTDAKVFSEKIKKINVKEKSNTELKELFKEFFRLNCMACAQAYDYRAIGEYYPQQIMLSVKSKLKNQKKLNAFMEEILSLPKPIEMNKEKVSMLEIAVKAKKRVSKEKTAFLLKAHTEKYAFFGMYIYTGEPFVLAHFQKELNNLLKKPVSFLEKELETEKNRFKQNEKKVAEIISELNLAEKEINRINAVRFSLWVSMVCDEFFTIVSFNVRQFLIEIAKRFSLSYNQLIEMQNHEILELFEKPLSKEKLNEINERMHDHVLILKNGKVRVLVGKELEEYSTPYLKELKKIEELIEIQGDTAFPGLVKGRVKLIKGVKDLPDFKKGDILVTGTTMPQYVPAMKKASAIVTDEGGMLSHAAIMSREFKTPCIIGTKVATRALKDGELIEVNATKGIIKRMEK